MSSMPYYHAENEPCLGRTSTLLVFVPILDRDKIQQVLNMANEATNPVFSVEIRENKAVTLATVNSQGTKAQHTKFVYALAKSLNRRPINGWED